MLSAVEPEIIGKPYFSCRPPAEIPTSSRRSESPRRGLCNIRSLLIRICRRDDHDLNVILGAGFFFSLHFIWLGPIPATRRVGNLAPSVALAVIWAVNVVGHYFGFHMGMNLVSALTVGVLGIRSAPSR